MAYDNDLAQRVRAYLTGIRQMIIEEKRMFGGLAFLVNGKMCINVRDDNLMCRFDPDKLAEISKRRGYRPMIMHGKNLPGYCYVSPVGFSQPDDFSYWMELCLSFNEQARATKSPK